MKKLYLYKLERDITLPVKDLPDFDSEYVSISGNELTIRKGYVWDGCSPKISVFDLFMLGTPDGVIDYKTGMPIALFASLIHDVLYQFNLGKRSNADRIFYTLLKGAGFKSARLYYIAVRLFGWIAWKKHGRELR